MMRVPNDSDSFPSKWRSLKIQQQPEYKDTNHLNTILTKVRSLPKIVHFQPIINLKKSLVQCSQNECFIIQAGDCAEKFSDLTDKVLEKKILLLNSISHIFSFYLKKPCVILGRMAGQFAKPRTVAFELINNKKVEVFRGEIVNDIHPDKREADPNRLLEAYFNSIAVINYINQWNLYAIKTAEVFKEIYNNNKYLIKSNNLINKVNFIYDNFPKDVVNLEENLIYTAHEGLLLNYEDCFVSQYQKKFFDQSAHNLWIGERTNNIDEAHIEFFSHLENPIGIKVSDRIIVEELINTIRKLNPINEKGKIILITRLGVNKVSDYLSKLCKKIIKEGINVLWICDPMHGNTKVLKKNGKKTRYFDDIKMEVLQTIDTLNEHSLCLNGIHLESSCENVTECIGGIDNIVFEEHINDNYNTYCDPRLNFEQSLELTDLIANVLVNGKNPSSSTGISD